MVCPECTKVSFGGCLDLTFLGKDCIRRWLPFRWLSYRYCWNCTIFRRIIGPHLTIIFNGKHCKENAICFFEGIRSCLLGCILCKHKFYSPLWIVLSFLRFLGLDINRIYLISKKPSCIFCSIHFLIQTFILFDHHFFFYFRIYLMAYILGLPLD